MPLLTLLVVEIVVVGVQYINKHVHGFLPIGSSVQSLVGKIDVFDMRKTGFFTLCLAIWSDMSLTRNRMLA